MTCNPHGGPAGGPCRVLNDDRSPGNSRPGSSDQLGRERQRAGREPRELPMSTTAQVPPAGQPADPTTDETPTPTAAPTGTPRVAATSVEPLLRRLHFYVG